MIRSAVFAMSCLAALPAVADPVEDLFYALELPQIIAVMREEGIAYGDQITADLLAGRDTADWEETVRVIYDRPWMEEAVLGQLRTQLEGKDVAAMAAFFTTEPGSTIVTLEVAGRSALLDEAVEEAATEAAQAAEGSDRLELIRAYIEANDLIEGNVAGALNANYAFYIGLVDGGAFDFELTEEQILTEVWAQEPEIRQSTIEWVESFLYMAYAPVPDADLETYIAFSQSEVGKQMNAALFAAFDPVFDQISRSLGFGAARYMVGEEL